MKIQKKKMGGGWGWVGGGGGGGGGGGQGGSGWRGQGGCDRRIEVSVKIKKYIYLGGSGRRGGFGSG